MRKSVLVLLGVLVAGGGIAAADVQLGGYLAPNLVMWDHGDGNKSNLGFGMHFNRFLLHGNLAGGEIAKNVGWKLECDFSQSGSYGLKWAFVQPEFGDHFSFRVGHHIKRAFSREILHPTRDLLTAFRHPTTSFVQDLGYGGFTYGLEAHLQTYLVKAHGGVYSSGTPQSVRAQDPALDYAGRAILMPITGLEIGVNMIMATLPAGGSNLGIYADSLYATNTGLAYGFDVDYRTCFDDMSLWAQAELGMGDSWGARDEQGNMVPMPKDPQTGDSWEDYNWHSFMYYYLKFRFMLNDDLGFHFGYSSIDPNTDEDDDAISMITPGITYYWVPSCRTEAEVQLHTKQQGQGNDDLEYTHFVLQTVLVWK
jgi:hypothetical protein